MPLEQAGTPAVVKETAFSRQQRTVRNPDIRTAEKVYFLYIYMQEVLVATNSKYLYIYI
jgi:hypothetical protein